MSWSFTSTHTFQNRWKHDQPEEGKTPPSLLDCELDGVMGEAGDRGIGSLLPRGRGGAAALPWAQTAQAGWGR